MKQFFFSCKSSVLPNPCLLIKVLWCVCFHTFHCNTTSLKGISCNGRKIITLYSFCNLNCSFKDIKTKSLVKKSFDTFWIYLNYW